VRSIGLRAGVQVLRSLLSNLRLKLSARGGHKVGNWIYLSVAAAGRRLSAIS
jgi:hypothetical protein